jgi:hypothetical protein
VNELVSFLNDRWSHLLNYDTQGVFSPHKLQSYATAIRDAGAPIDSVIGFIDCTIRRICRPSDFQRQCYNGHKHFHALKYQAVVLPNGLFGHLFGAVEGRHNDNWLLAESGLLGLLEEHARDENNQVYQIFGDPAYGVSPVMLSPFASPLNHRTEVEQRWNSEMARFRIEVEHSFAIVLNLWPFLNSFWKHHIYASPLGLYYRAGVLLTNAHN